LGIAGFERGKAELVLAVVFEVRLSPAEVGRAVANQFDEDVKEIERGPAVAFGQGLEGDEESFNFLAGKGRFVE